MVLKCDKECRPPPRLERRQATLSVSGVKGARQRPSGGPRPGVAFGVAMPAKATSPSRHTKHRATSRCTVARGGQGAPYRRCMPRCPALRRWRAALCRVHAGQRPAWILGPVATTGFVPAVFQVSRLAVAASRTNRRSRDFDNARTPLTVRLTSGIPHRTHRPCSRRRWSLAVADCALSIQAGPANMPGWSPARSALTRRARWGFERRIGYRPRSPRAGSSNSRAGCMSRHLLRLIEFCGQVAVDADL